MIDAGSGSSRLGGLGLAGEVSSLGDGRDVGAVVGEDGLEDVAGFGEVVGVGDDVDAVLVAAAGGADVEAAVGGGGETSSMATSTVSAWLPCSVAA